MVSAIRFLKKKQNIPKHLYLFPTFGSIITHLKQPILNEHTLLEVYRKIYEADEKKCEKTEKKQVKSDRPNL